MTRPLYFTLAAICLTLTACGDSGKSSAVDAITKDTAPSKPAQDAPPKIRVALIMKTLTNPFFVEMEKGARSAQAETGLDLQVQTATQETSIEQQIQLVEREIQSNAKAIVIAPGDSTRLVPVLKKAQDAGIRIVNIDNRLNADALKASGMAPVPFVSVDNEKGAYEVTKYLLSTLKKPTEVAIFEGIRTADNAYQRKQGAERALKEGKGMRLVASESANWKIDEAYELSKTVFKKHPSIGAVFCANDMMAFGVIKYLQESKRANVMVASFDALEEAKTAIRAGQLQATVDQQAFRQGYLGVTSALRLINGEPVPMEVVVDSKLVTPSSLK